MTCGDPNGVGMETIMKVFSDSRMLEQITPVIYAHPDLVKANKKANKIEEFTFNTVPSAAELIHRKVNLVPVVKDFQLAVEFGKPDKAAGEFAFRSIEMAATDLASNRVDVLVTCPINKDTIQGKEFNFPGHTEYLARMAGTEKVLMFLVGPSLRVGVVTGHLPLKDVSSAITRDKIMEKLVLMRESLLRDFSISSPRIAVLGLNPHAGDNGLLGSEEREIIAPAIREATEKGWHVYGPYGADGFFGSGAFGKFDAVLAMYHDQGLTPFKALAFESGVNYTAGLPVVRTSPDHGTAYDLAGKGLADESSLRAAVFLACDIYSRRKEYKEYASNPLSRQDVKDSRDDKRE
ncbi:MAG: 4-hydroxythreonine-4-phosphate dehydrogenase PdxA [Bacteroidota bacterium]